MTHCCHLPSCDSCRKAALKEVESFHNAVQALDQLVTFGLLNEGNVEPVENAIDAVQRCGDTGNKRAYTKAIVAELGQGSGGVAGAIAEVQVREDQEQLCVLC